MTSTKLFSIITPVFNREDCIIRCLDSVKNQSIDVSLFEHIVVDDGSSDKTPILIRDYAASNPHVHFILFPENKGTNAARNAAIKEANGEYCIILDSDDHFVCNALSIILETIRHGEYKHYLFATNDMLPVYRSNPLLVGGQKELLFKDFLGGTIGYDYVHVVKTTIMTELPFDESLRIYEGVFFMRFYKKAKKILYTENVVTNRERNRKDSVTRMVFRTNIAAIQKSIKATELQIEWFADDYVRYNHLAVLCQLQSYLLDNYLLVGDYNKAHNIIKILKSNDYKISNTHIIVCLLRLGFMYRNIIKIYLIVKYSILHKKLKV